jgi:hypothetical protein
LKFPRWLVVSMLTASGLAVITVLGGGVWWWCTAPERTARRFATLLAERDLDAVNEMLAHGPAGDYRDSKWIISPDTQWPFATDNWFSKWSTLTLNQKPRSILDIIHQRLRFFIVMDDFRYDPHEMLVEREAIAIEFGVGSGATWEPPENWDKPLRILSVEIRDPNDRWE